MCQRPPPTCLLHTMPHKSWPLTNFRPHSNITTCSRFTRAPREEHVFLRQPGEDEAAAMLRVLAMDEKQVFARRKALCKLRDDMNRRAQGLLEGYIRQALGT